MALLFVDWRNQEKNWKLTNASTNAPYIHHAFIHNNKNTNFSTILMWWWSHRSHNFSSFEVRAQIHIYIDERAHTPIHSIFNISKCVCRMQAAHLFSLSLVLNMCMRVWLRTSYIVHTVLYISQHITDILSHSLPCYWSEIAIGVSIRLFLFQLNNFIKYVSMPQPMVEFVGWIYMFWFVSLVVQIFALVHAFEWWLLKMMEMIRNIAQ